MTARPRPRRAIARRAVPSLALVTALAAACATPPPRPAGAEADSAAVDTTPDPPRTGQPTGYLTWEDLGVRMIGQGSTAGLRIDVTTLDDAAVALASDDVRAYFREVKSRIGDAVPPVDAEAMHAFLVGFTGREKEVSFDPTLLLLRSEGSTYYPRYVVPVSPKFDRRLVDLYETVYGIYLFEPDIDLNATLEFQYDDLSSGGQWRSVVEAIQRAKTRGGAR